MKPDAPFELDHAGFTARFWAPREERLWSLGFLVFAPLWACIVGFGVYSEGTLSSSLCCMMTTVPLIGLVSVLGTEAAITRHTLQLANGELRLVRRRIGSRTRILDPRGMEVSAHETFGSKGGRRAWLQLELADGETLEIAANNWRQSDLDELAAVVQSCASRADAPTALVPPQALQALRRG